MRCLPKKWQWLEKTVGIPLIVRAAIAEYGTLEVSGSADNPRILKWADEVAKCHPTPYNNWAADWYNNDSIPWCGLFMAVLACRTAGGKSDRLPVAKYLAALSWAAWGIAVPWRNARGRQLNNIWIGDCAVFVRAGGGHVGIVVGVSKDGKYIYVLGGNQSDQVNIMKLPVTRLYAVRRPLYRVRPLFAKHVRLTTSGAISTNEA